MRLHPLPDRVIRQHWTARRIFRLAVQRGTVKPSSRCERCGRGRRPGTLGRIEAHHSDYSRPLLVEWLCHFCHLRADDEVRAILRALPDTYDYSQPFVFPAKSEVA